MDGIKGVVLKPVKPVVQKLTRQGTVKQCQVARVGTASEICLFGGGDGLAADPAKDEAAAGERRERGGMCGNPW